MSISRTPALFVGWLLLASTVSAADRDSKYLLRYKFSPGETLRWEVEHRALVRTTVQGTTQTAETTSTSVKVWQVSDVAGNGQITFVHSVERVQMRQKLTGRQEVTYDSQTDQDSPIGFQDVAKSIGVPLSVVTIDPRGTVVRREDKHPRSAEQQNQLTIPLPAEPVAPGDQWKEPLELKATARDGKLKTIKAQRKLTLEEVKAGVAIIKSELQILSPISDPAIEAQVVQGEADGKIRFDIDAGRVLGQQNDSDRHVVGFQGEASSLHYVTRFVERLLPPDAKVAARPQAPPAAAPLAAPPAQNEPD